MTETRCPCGGDHDLGPDSNFAYALQAVGIPTVWLTGPECDGIACDEYEHRPGCDLYDDSECAGCDDSYIWDDYGDVT